MGLHGSSRWTSALTVFAVCFALRLLVGTVIDVAVPVMKRADIYSGIAENLTRGHGFVAEPGGEPITWRAPLYPAFLAGIYRLFGEHNEAAVFVAQVGLDSITAVLVWGMGRRLFGNSLGLCAAIAFALNPLSAYYSLRFMSEPLFTLGFTAVVAAWVWAVEDKRPVAFMAVGALVAVASLVKPVALGLGPLLAGCAIYRLWNEPGRAIAAVTALTIACLLVLAPWTLRNYRVTGQVVAVATGGGYALWLGNQMASEGREDWEVDGTMRTHLFELRNAVLAPVGLSVGHHLSSSKSPKVHSSTEPVNITVEEDRAFLRAAWGEIASHPFESALLTIRKVFRFWFRIFMPENRWAQAYVIVFQTFVMSFAIPGIMDAKRRSGILFPFLFPMVFLVVAHALTFATLRYSLPIFPVMTIFMVAGMREVVHAVDERFGLSLGGSVVRFLRVVPSRESAALCRRKRL